MAVKQKCRIQKTQQPGSELQWATQPRQVFEGHVPCPPCSISSDVLQRRTSSSVTRGCCVSPWAAGHVSITPSLCHRTECQINKPTGRQRRRDSCLWPHGCSSGGLRKWGQLEVGFCQHSSNGSWGKMTWTDEKFFWDLHLR